MTEEINLQELNLNHFTVLDAELYCKMLNINPDNIKYLFLNDNKLEDMQGVSIFKNLGWLFLYNNKTISLGYLKNLSVLKGLYLGDNPINDISFIENLINLEYLDIDNLDLTDEIKTVKILKNLPNLKTLICRDTFKKIKKNDIKKLLKRIEISD